MYMKIGIHVPYIKKQMFLCNNVLKGHSLVYLPNVRWLPSSEIQMRRGKFTAVNVETNLKYSFLMTFTRGSIHFSLAGA